VEKKPHQEFIQIAHPNVCSRGGARRRPGEDRLRPCWKRGIGFGAEVYSKAEIDTQDHFAEACPRIDKLG